MVMEDHYSAKVAVVYVFNLIVGAGALALPLAFAETGWVLGIIALIVLAIMSFITATFMVEAMSIANAVTSWQRDISQLDADGIEKIREISASQQLPINTETTALLGGDAGFHVSDPRYRIIQKMEMGQMSKLFFGPVGIKLFYLSLALYLYGDLAIYAAAVPKSLTLVTCMNLEDTPTNATEHKDYCFKHFTKEAMYRIYVLIFALVVGPFVFFNLGKTKYLQFVTTLFRWIAFILMIVLALYHIVKHNGTGNVTTFDITKLPTFFGVAVYSFMCQHSLPSILTPTRQKKYLSRVLVTSFSLVSGFYLLLATTAVFYFPKNKIEDLYTLNFLKEWKGFAYFLALFPVFTLSTSFPIIGITLRENIKSIFLKEGGSFSPFVDRFIFPLVTVLPPFGIAIITQNVELLVGVTGSYAGSLIQYVVPAMLVYYGRRKAKELFGIYTNAHRSMFRQPIWIMFVIVWTILCLILVTTKYMLDLFVKKH